MSSMGNEGTSPLDASVGNIVREGLVLGSGLRAMKRISICRRRLRSVMPSFTES